MSESPHTLIHASAGTGKTYQLSGRYLALLLDGVAPERILATTFTRKAAGEILDRVLRRLVEAAERPAKLDELNAQLAEEGVPFATAESCVALLGALTRSIHPCRVRTLDAFFVQLAGVFALDLGLPPTWRILDDDEVRVLTRDALSDALGGAQRAELLELLRAMQKADASRSVEWSLLSAIENTRDAYLDSDAPAWDRIQVPEGLDETHLAQALLALEDMPLPTTKKGDEDKTWAAARRTLLQTARAGDWDSALDRGMLAKLASGETKFSRHELTDVHLGVLEPLLQHAAHELLAGVRRQNQASFAWLERFETAFFTRKDASSGLSFEDVPRALVSASGLSDGEGRAEVHATRDFDLGYRLDGQIDHLLLDEFQDTSPVQWRVLAPLAEEILATGDGQRSFFCVGDVKQSIYAWRSGEPRLLAEMHGRYPSLPEPTELIENWRSSAVVLDTVDRVFGSIAESSAFSAHAAQGAAARAFEADYSSHVAARKLPGSVTLYEAPPADEGGSDDLPALIVAADRAAVLARQAPHATIAVLLRRNQHVARMIDLLRRRGLRASGEGGNPLVDSAAVLHALSAFQLADHPGDSAAAFHLATSPLAEALAADIDARARDLRRALSQDLRARLAHQGFGKLLGDLLSVVESSPQYGPWDAKRFAQLVDLGYAFDRREELRTGAFLDFVRTTTVEDPSSTQITVMTVHASKGLEFDAVLLPELDASMTLRDPDVLRSRPDPEAPLSGVSVSAPHAVCALDPEGLDPIRREEDQRYVQEALCIFYVAMTRAAHLLELIVRPKGARTAKLSYAHVLRDMLLTTPSALIDQERGDREPNDPEPGDSATPDTAPSPTVLWRHPDSADRWWPKARTDEAPAPSAPLRRPRFGASTTPRDLRRKSPSAEEGGHRIEVADLLRPRAGRGFTRGSLIHRWMQEIVWLDEFALEDAELDRLGVAIEPDAEARAAALRAFRASLAHEAVRSVLTRPADRGDTSAAAPDVWRERTFTEVVQEQGETVLWSGSFDRVVVTRDAQGRATRAEVLDYKTDRVAAGGVEARAAFYAPQLESYAKVLARMTGLAPDAVATTLIFLEPGVVKRLPPPR